MSSHCTPRPAAHLARSELWRELLTGYGVTDGASAAFRDKHGCWGFLDLWRCGARFSDDELDLLSQLLAPVTRGLRRCVAGDLPRTGTAPRSTGPVVLLLSPDLQVRAQTAETAEYLRLLVPRDDGLPPVPANAYNVAAQLLAVEAGVDANPPVARVHLAVGRWLTLRATRIGPDTVRGRRTSR